MNPAQHFFDPALAQRYIKQIPECSIKWDHNNAELQNLFYQLNQSGQQQNMMPKAYAYITQQLQQVRQNYTADCMIDDSAANLSNLQAAIIPPLEKSLRTQDNLYHWLKQSAAIVLTQPLWLQNISPSAASQSTPAIELISIYLQLTQSKQKGANLQQSYRAMLLASGTEIPELYSARFSQNIELIPQVLAFATLQLALSRFPRVFLPEILGFTLAYCQLPGIIETCFPAPDVPGRFLHHQQQVLQQQIEPLQQCIVRYLDLFPQQTQALWLRILNGYWLYQWQMQCSRDQFNATLQVSFPRQQVVAKLLQQKRGAAMGHHQKIQLQGKSLDKWFAGLPDNRQEFLDVLIQSDYVDKQNPAHSRLLQLFDFKGPMFGVLNKTEQDILLDWLKEATKDQTIHSQDHQQAAHTVQVASAPVQTSNTRTNLKRDPPYTKPDNRALFYYLLNVDLFPGILPAAKAKVHHLLYVCELLNPRPFKHYSHQQFDAYIHHIYQQEINSYSPLQGQPKISKAAYIWGFEQVAPMILTDGSWIQNSLTLQNINPEISHILFNTYCDEIGHGVLERNHPYIFQQLLDSLSIHVPPVYSREFIEHPGFINSAFDLPAFMLSLSSFSVEFLPELLGLNMAIELSGLGKSYMRLVDDWNYWGIDPSIANIHISIDNYASGHSFQAKRAIQIYMDEVLQNTGDPLLVNKHWKRIFRGYASLRFVGGRFKFGLPIYYLLHKLKHQQG